LFYIALELLPVPAPALRRYAPHVELEYSFGYGRSLEGLVRAVHFGQLHGSLHSAVIDRFENVFVQASCFRRVERHAELNERVRQTLDANTDGTVAQVRPAGFFDRIVVDVDNLVKVTRHYLGDFVQLVVIEG